MRKFIVLPLLVLLAACTEQMAVGPEGDPGFVAAKGGKGKGGGGGGGGGGGEALPTDVAAIVFVKRSGLSVMNADGANQTKVYGTVGVATPSWSPKGESIVFHEWIDGQDWIRTIDITIGDDGSVSAGGATDLLQCIPYFGTFYANCHPAWSPLGDKIAIADGMSRPASIRIVDLSDKSVSIAYTAPSGWWGSPERKVYNALRWPTWSPEGDRIAFVEGGVVVDDECTSGGGVCISIIAFNGIKWDPPKICPLQETFVGTFAYANSLEWARTAESNTLVFSGVVYGEEGGIFMLNTDNCKVSGPIVIDGRGSVWSPDDQWIAWVRGRNDQLMLYSVSTRSSYNVASNVRDPDWHRIN